MSDRKNICVIGAGYVGLPTAAVLAELGHRIIIVDKIKEKVSMINEGKSPIHEEGLQDLLYKYRENITATQNLEDAIANTDKAIVCVGTPGIEKGSMDDRYVKESCEEIGEVFSKLVNPEFKYDVIIKSTVLPGTTEKCIDIIRERSGALFPNNFSMAMNPEFLREGTAINDTRNPDRIVIGSSDTAIIGRLAEIYEDLGTHIPIIGTGFKEAEISKYASNVALALRIAFSNEIGNICKQVGVDVNKVMEIVGSDHRVGKEFLRAGIGYGGSCFPKDTKALHYYATTLGYIPRLLQALIDINNEQPNKLIELLDERLERQFAGQKIGILGLAFKDGTDDIRESPAIRVLERLIPKRVDLTLYDPLAMGQVREIYHQNDKLVYAVSIEELISRSEIILLTTEWPEFRDVDYGEKRVFDGKNVFGTGYEHLRPKNYEGVCW